MFPVTLVNRHHERAPAFGANRVFCGRGSPLGNRHRLGVHGDRRTVIAKFAHDLETPSPAQNAELNRLVDLALQAPLELECYCVPLDCHTRIIREHILKRAALRERGTASELTPEQQTELRWLRDELLDLYDGEGAERWLSSPQQELGGAIPVDLVVAGRGAEVRAVIEALDDGAYC